MISMSIVLPRAPWQARLMDAGSDVLRAAVTAALDYAASVDDRRVAPERPQLAALAAFDEPLPEVGASEVETLERLDSIGSPATVATTGRRYFGFVNGATHPVALGSAWLASSWDQNAALPVMSPVAAKLHDVVRGWLVEALRLPTDTGVAFVSGATVANASCLAAARDALLGQARLGRPVRRPVRRSRAPGGHRRARPLDAVEVTRPGRPRPRSGHRRARGRPGPHARRPAARPRRAGAGVRQAGEVNTGAFDPFDEIADWVAARSGWLHVDGAFGLWALADPGRADLVRGLDRADSWATDGHKWLNVTYDCGIAFVRRLADLRRTFSATAGYLPPSDGFEAMHHTPQSSQRARQVEVWAVLRTLGRQGLEQLVVQRVRRRRRHRRAAARRRPHRSSTTWC